MLMELANAEPGNTDRSDERIVEVSVKGPDRAIQGVLDVVTLAALSRAISALMKRNDAHITGFDSALAKAINTNGSLAEAILKLRSFNG